MKVSFSFAWYDIWIGAYWDRKVRALYVCPLPCCAFRFSWPYKPHDLEIHVFDSLAREIDRTILDEWERMEAEDPKP